MIHHIAVFMYKFRKHLLPPVFDSFFRPAKNLHKYNARFSSKKKLSLPQVRTNYGIFNMKFQSAKI